MLETIFAIITAKRILERLGIQTSSLFVKKLVERGTNSIGQFNSNKEESK